MQVGSVVKLNETVANQLNYPVDRLYTVESVKIEESNCVLIGLPYIFSIDQLIEVTDYQPVMQYVKMKVIKTSEHTIIGSYALGQIAPFELSNIVTLSVEDTNTEYEPIGIVENVSAEIMSGVVE